MTRVAIVGGGYAGMAAAVALADRGIPVDVFEAAPVLGGRARRTSYRDETLDNGQHILVGAYRALMGLIDRVAPGGSDGLLLRLPLELRIEGRLALRARALPAPLHLVAALALASGLTAGQRLAAALFVARLRLAGFRLEKDTTFDSLMASHGQTGPIATLLWEPLCTAALNTPPSVASAQVFLNVLHDTFARTRSDSDLLLPRVDLSALFPEPAAAFVQQRGGTVRTGRRIARIECRPDGSFGVGETSYTHAICATAPAAAAALASGIVGLEPLAAALEALPQQPIVTVYLKYATPPPLPAPMTGLTGALGQWVFDRDRLYGQRGLVAVVISAEGRHRELTHDDLARHVHDELARTFDCPTAPEWYKVIAEKQATFACTAGLERPPHVCGVRGLYFAGDYVAGAYPATLEAAVRSGLQCAMEIAS